MRDLADLVRSRRLRYLGSSRTARLRRLARLSRPGLRDISSRQLAWNHCKTYNSGFFDNACCKHLKRSGGRESIFVHVGQHQQRASSRLQATCRTALLKSDEIIELTPAVSDSYRGIGVRASAGMSCPAGVVQKPPGLAYLFPEFCRYDHAMRDIANSDIEYDLGEINTSISVDEAHSNGLARACNNSGD